MRNIVFAAMLAMTISGCNQGLSCAKLEEIAGRERVRTYLKTWVDERIRSGDYLFSENSNYGRLSLPGEYAVDINLDAVTLGMQEPEARAIIGSARRIESFFFGEENYRGILVKANSGGGYGFPSNRLSTVDERTAIVCIDHSIFP